MPVPSFAPHNSKTNANDPSSSSRGWSSPQDLKPSINEKKNHQSRIKRTPRAARQKPMECETMLYQPNDNRVRKVSLRDSPDGGGGMSMRQIPG